MIKIGVVGYGYWGPNIVRNFNSVEGAEVTAVCDKNIETLKKLTLSNPGLKTVTNVQDIVTSPEIDVVAVVTPVSTHFEITKAALINWKHVFVEKPFTDTSAHAQELIEIADKKHLKIMVDHTFLFTGAVKKIKELIDGEALGKIYYYDSTRVNLGLFQHDVNVIWDLAPHDFSIMSYIIHEAPVALSACGTCHVNDMENIAYINVFFQSNLLAHFNVNWISPVKVRTTFIGGAKKMLVWDDVAADEKIKVYDKGFEVKSTEGIHNLLVSYRTGDMWAPKIEQREALRFETQYFIDCIKNNTTPFNDGIAGLQVVKMLEACKASIMNQGKMVAL
jgi:Predicted dehydrogenases and related proteins